MRYLALRLLFRQDLTSYVHINKTLKYIIIKMFKYVKYKYIYYFAIPSMILVMFNHKYIRCEGVIIGALN